MISGRAAYYDVAVEILSAARDGLATTPAGIPDRVGVVDGRIAFDHCECGLLAVAMDRAYLTDLFPAEQAAVTNCNVAYTAVDYSVQVLRCAPSPPDGQLAPSVRALDESAQVVLRDAYELLEKVTCRLAELRDTEQIADFLTRPLVAVGPEGGCVGSLLQVTVALERYST